MPWILVAIIGVASGLAFGAAAILIFSFLLFMAAIVSALFVEDLGGGEALLQIVLLPVTLHAAYVVCLLLSVVCRRRDDR